MRAVTPAADTEFSVHASAADRLTGVCAVRRLLPVPTTLLLSRPTRPLIMREAMALVS